ncbi:MAG: LytTR family DNA-binding domain-containing protein [Bacteroidota bacterium]|nr:LytTR family DNA-binding domain-containing protein [Bacteroidota bacterium]
MSRIKVIIIDDEKPARELLQSFFADDKRFEVVASCEDGFKGVKAIQQYNPDIIFLDIKMPKINGFEMLELLDNPPVVIFSTAYDEYAVKAFEVNAVDYLLKPFTRKRFSDALNRAVNKLENGSYKEEIKDFQKNIDEEKKQLSRVVVKKHGKIIIIPLDEIEYLEAMDDYVAVHSKGKKYLKQKTMKSFENQLPPQNFVRIHRSSIVNLDFVKTIEPYSKDSWILITTADSRLNVSRSGMKKLNELIDLRS